MNSIKKGTNCCRKSTEPQELPHIVTRRRQLEKVQELTNDQFSRVTILAHKPQEEQELSSNAPKEKNSNLRKGTKIVTNIEQPCQEAKLEHIFS
jgi:hypothetical protein